MLHYSQQIVLGDGSINIFKNQSSDLTMSPESILLEVFSSWSLCVLSGQKENQITQFLHVKEDTHVCRVHWIHGMYIEDHVPCTQQVRDLGTRFRFFTAMLAAPGGLNLDHKMSQGFMVNQDFKLIYPFSLDTIIS